MKRKTTMLAALAVALVLGMGIAPAWAYFTDTTQATGGLRINVTPSTDINEWYGQSTKHVVVTNDADATTPVFVRARVFSAQQVAGAGTGWRGPDEDGWYVYGTAVEPGGATEELAVTITFPPVKSETEPDGAQMGASFNVVVVYESTPAKYDAEGNPDYDWSMVLDSVVEEGGR